MELSDADNQNPHSLGECEMKMPSSIAGWCTLLFFLMVALGSFGIFSNEMITGVLAAGVVVFTLIGK